MTHVSPRELSGFSAPARRAIALANLLGWTTRLTGRRDSLVEMISPGGEKKINLPRTSVNAHRLSSTMSALIRYSSTDALLDVVVNDENLVGMDEDTLAIRAVVGTDLLMWVQEVREKRLAEEKAEASDEQAPDEPVQPSWTDTPYVGTSTLGNWWVRTHQDGHVEWVCKNHDPEMVVRTLGGIGGHNRTLHTDSPLHEKRAVLVAQGAEQERLRSLTRDLVLASQRPWLARRGGSSTGAGKMYPSGRVTTLTYTNGTVLYSCNGCGILAEQPRSISAHASKMHPELPTGVDEVFTVEQYEETGIRRNPGAAARLKRELLAALQSMDEVPTSQEALAAALAEQIMANRTVETEVDPTPAEPLSAEEVLRRIASLVDRGQTARLFESIDTLTSQLVEATTRAEECAARADRAEGEMDALRELIGPRRQQ